MHGKLGCGSIWSPDGYFKLLLVPFASISNYLLNKTILLVIKINLTGDPDALIFSTEKFTAYILGENYLLNEMILLIIKISLTSALDSLVISVGKFNRSYPRR
jgi:hypothetical protein